MLRAARPVHASILRRARSTISGPSARVRYRPALQVLDVGLDAVDVPDVRQRIEILESIQLVKERRISGQTRRNILDNVGNTGTPVENYVPVLGGLYTSPPPKRVIEDPAEVAKREEEADLFRSRLILGDEAEAKAYVADRKAQRKHEEEIQRVLAREEAMDEYRPVPLKANDPDPSKLTLDEQALPDDDGMFHDQLYPALRNKPRIVYVPDTYNDDSPFFQAKMIKENPETPGELLEVEVRGKNLHMPPKKLPTPKIRGHQPSKSFVDRLAYEDMTELDDYAKVALANPDPHHAWNNPDMFTRNQELSYASYPRHPDFADPFRVLPPLTKGCGFCKRRWRDRRLEPMNIPFLIRFLYPDGSIMRRAHTGLCNRHQKKVARNIKRARCMKLFTFKHGVFGVNTPYVLPKIWELHLDTLKVPHPLKMDSKHEEELVDTVYEAAYDKKLDRNPELPSVPDGIAYDDAEEAEYPIGDPAIEREIEANRLHIDKQRAGDKAFQMSLKAEIVSAQAGLLAEASSEAAAEIAAKNKQQGKKEKTADPNTLSQHERAHKVLEDEMEQALAAEERAEEEPGVTDDTIEEGLAEVTKKYDEDMAKEHERMMSARAKWQQEEDAVQQLLNATREREIKAAKEEKAAKAGQSAASQARRATAEARLQSEALAAGLKPAKAEPVTSSGATTEEKSLESAANALGKKARWWRESIANVDSATKDPAIVARLDALVEYACNAATARGVSFLKPTARSAALLLLLQTENRPPHELPSARSHLTRLNAESVVLARELLSIIGSPAQPLSTTEELQAHVLDKLDAVKDQMRTPKQRATRAALKERADALSSIWTAPVFADILTATERDVKAAERPNDEALLLFRMLRASPLLQQ